jgi:hypothetical protein
MTREKMKSIFIVHTNGQDEYIKVPKRTYDKMIDKLCDKYEAEINDKNIILESRVEMYQGATKALDEQFKECKRKNQRIMELEEELESFYNFSKTVSSAKP